MIDDLRLYLMGAAAGLVVLIVFLLLTLIKKYKEKIIAMIKKTFDNMLFNGTIRSITIVYI
jgi:hypothetical protein